MVAEKPAPAATSAPAVTADAVKERILALVVEKTGYPKDMLDLDLDLEADLGVDTVKQAEMFAAIREIYNIPRDENRKLRDYPTLAHVIRFVFEKRPDLAGAPAAPSAAGYQRANRDLPPSPVAAQAATDDADQGEGARDRGREDRAIPKTCWTSTLISKPTSASTPSNKRRCSRRCERRTTFRAMRTSSCATSRPWPT